jgi:predicted nucleotidyltransferase
MNTKTKPIHEFIEELRNLLPKLQTQYQVQSLEVFGSYVRGDETSDSDLDLLVTFNESPSLFKFVKLGYYLGDQFGVKVDLVMKESLKPAIGKRILAEAQSI